MKLIGIIASCLLVGSLSSCIQAPTAAVLERVDVKAAEPVAPIEKGTLIVFSAFETGPASPIEIDPDNNHHSDYEIYGDGGRLVTKVKNRSGAFGEAPATVELSPGTYQLIAEANGYGRITIPVLIADRQVTTVHLEGGTPLPHQSDFAEAYLVRLPSGRTVGWCATTSTDWRR